MIKLSLDNTLHSWDNNIEAMVSPTTKLEIELHTSRDLVSPLLQYSQGPVPKAVEMEGQYETFTAEIPGANLVSGPLTLSVRSRDVLTNTFDIRVNVIEDPELPRDDDAMFEVDRDSRKILIPPGYAFLAVAHDKNSEVLTFKVPRYADGVDLSTKTPYVHYQSADPHQASTQELTVQSVEEGYIILTWLVGGEATGSTGPVKFGLLFQDVPEEGATPGWPKYIWQTQPTELPVVDSVFSIINKSLGN